MKTWVETDLEPEEILVLEGVGGAKGGIFIQSQALARLIAEWESTKYQVQSVSEMARNLGLVRETVGEELTEDEPPPDPDAGESVGRVAERVKAERRAGLYAALERWSRDHPGEKLPPGDYLITKRGGLLLDNTLAKPELPRFKVREDGAVVDGSGRPAITPSEYGKSKP